MSQRLAQARKLFQATDTNPSTTHRNRPKYEEPCCDALLHRSSQSSDSSTKIPKRISDFPQSQPAEGMSYRAPLPNQNNLSSPSSSAFVQTTRSPRASAKVAVSVETYCSSTRWFCRRFDGILDQHSFRGFQDLAPLDLEASTQILTLGSYASQDPARCPDNVATKSVFESGFARNPFMPASRQLSMSSEKALALKPIIGVWIICGDPFRMRRVVSNPSIPGILTSIRTRSNCFSRISLIAISPLSAVQLC